MQELSLSSDGRSETSEQVSIHSKTTRRAITTTRYRWKNYWQYISSSLACTLSLCDLETFCILDLDQEPYIIHHIITCTFVVLPIYYMEIFLGKYTQLGIIVLKYLSPVGHGLAFSFMVNVLMRLIKYGILMSDFFIYLFMSMRSPLQWMHCPSHLKHQCWNGENNCTSNCLNENTNMSGNLYYMENYFENPITDPNNTSLGIPSFPKMIVIFITWTLTNIITRSAKSYYRKVLQYLISITCGLILIIFGVVIVIGGQFDAVSKIFYVDFHTLADMNAWSESVNRCIQFMALGRAFHVVQGSFMAPNYPVGILSVVVVSLNFGFALVASVITQSCFLFVQKTAFLDEAHLKYIYVRRGHYIYFVLIPQALGTMNVAHLWNVLYFITAIITLIFNQLTHMTAIERSVCDAYPTLIRYKKYIHSIICIVGTLVGIILSSREMYLFEKMLHYDLSLMVENFNVFILCLIIFWVYGTQKFCDDIHFLTGCQPSNFWKFLWYGMPVILFITHIYKVYFQETIELTKIITYIIIISPIPIIAGIETFNFVKKRNLVGLFQAEECYGMPDPRERYLRRIFNPRKEIRSRRRTELCHHNCLIGNKILRRIMQEELRYKMEYMLPRDSDLLD